MIKINQKGITAIIFAMVFAVVLTLIGVSFTYLVRQEQREVLDKTLSNQAQYAAETAINRVAYQLMENPELAEQKDCLGNSLTLEDTGTTASAKVTCINYSAKVTSITKDALGEEPYVTRLKVDSDQYNKFKIEWASSADGKTVTYPDSTILPTIDNHKIPILRLTAAIESAYNPTIVYLVPSTSGSSSGDIKSTNGGKIFKVGCTDGVCSFTFNLKKDDGTTLNLNDLWLNLVSYGGNSNIKNISVLNTSGNVLPIIGAQAVIDANARAQDITKRIKTKVSLIPQTWNPGYLTNANNSCKDYKTDGDTNASSISSPASGAPNACP